jgi:drug/metabolite transporter (DMT)-like permease
VSALLGLIGAAAYLSYFTGLQIGPISVVSGVVAAYGGLTVVLSVVIRGETLTTVQAFGAAVATVGVILTGIAFEGGWRGTRFAGPGVAFAVVALVMFAAMSIVTDIALETIDWLPLMIMARGFNAFLSIAILVVLARRGGRSAERPVGAPPWSRTKVALAIVVAGTLDVLGLISFVIGLETAPTWMVGLASSFGPAVTIIAAVAFLGERLKPIQWAGLVGILVGMVAIGLPTT